MLIAHSTGNEKVAGPKRKRFLIPFSLLIVVLGGCSQTGGNGEGTCSTPTLTEGPYFVDENLNRSDIRSDAGSGAVEEGTLLRLVLTIVDAADCTPIPDAQVDIWSANASGTYSDIASEGTVGREFLRGYQVTDADGVVEFTTIFPGWYSGRTIHSHIKVRSGTQEFNTQLFFEQTVTNQILAETPYADRGPADTTNSEDGIFSAETVVPLTPEGDGYAGSLDIGV